MKKEKSKSKTKKEIAKERRQKKNTEMVIVFIEAVWVILFLMISALSGFGFLLYVSAVNDIVTIQTIFGCFMVSTLVFILISPAHTVFVKELRKEIKQNVQ